MHRVSRMSLAAAVVAANLFTQADDAVLHRTMRFVGGSGSWTNPQNWYDVNGKTNDVPRETDIIAFDTKESDGAKNDIPNFRAYGLRLSAFNQGYAKTGFLPVCLNAADDYGIYDTGFIYSTIPVRVTGTNLQFYCSQFFGLTGEFSSADGNPIGLVKRGGAVGGLSPSGLQTGVTDPYRGLKYVEVAEGTFVFNANAKVADDKLSLFPSGLVATFSAKGTTLAFNGNFTLADFTLRETGTAAGNAHAISPQSPDYSGSIRLTGTPGADTTVFTGRMSGDFGFAWAPASSAKTFVFSGANAVSDMSGTLDVVNGTVRLENGASFTKLAKALVKTGARLEVLSAPATAFSVETLSVPETGGALHLAEGVSLAVGAVRLATSGVKAGTYTGNGPLGTPVAWLSGPGTVVVARDSAHRIYWRATTAGASTSSSGDGGALANWSEEECGSLIAAKALPGPGDVIVFDNRLYTKSFAPTAAFNASLKSKGLGGLLFEGTGYVKNGSWSIVWGEPQLYVNGDGGVLSNAVTTSGGPVCWANVNLVGTGRGVTMGAVKGTTWTQLRSVDGPAPINIEGPGTVQLIDYSHSDNMTHEPGQSYYNNYHIAVPAINMRNGTTDIQCWYKLTNVVVRFDSDISDLTLKVGVAGTAAGQRDLWFGNGTYLEESASVRNTTHKLTSTGEGAFLHVKDTPGKRVQTFTGNLSGKLGLDFDPSEGEYEFVFAKGTSDTTGELRVGNGTVRVTDGAAFTALSKIVLGTTGVLAVEPGAGIAAETVEIADGATISIRRGGRLAFQSVTVDGVPVEAGIYGNDSGWITGDGRVYVGDIGWPDGQTAVWNRDEYPWRATGENWYEGIRLYGEGLTREDLSAAENAEVYLGASGIDLSTAKSFAFGWPITLSGDQTWNLVAGSRLDFWGAFNSYEPGQVTVSGTTAGKQIIFWSPSETVHDWWFGAKTTVVLRDGAGCGTGRIIIDDSVLRPCGGTIPNEIAFTNLAEGATGIFAMDNSAESTFTGPVRLQYANNVWVDGSKAPLRFSGVLSKPRGYVNFRANGTYSFDAPVSFGTGAVTFDAATLYMNAATNVVGSNNFQFGKDGRLFTTVPYALCSKNATKVNMNVDKSGAAVWNLCGCDQSVTYLKGGPYSTVTSETAAVVHINSTDTYASDTHGWASTAYNGGVPTNYVHFAGGAGLQIDGDAKGYVRLAALSSTTGTLTVAGGGLVEMAASQFYPPDGKTYAGSWPNARAVNVTKGTLDIQHRQAFGKETALALSGTAAQVKLSYPGVMMIGRLVLDGVEQPSGVYGSLTSNAWYKDARLTGTGLLGVGKLGLALIFR